ncbi:MAG: glycosyltransferase family 2 protein [Chloroflexota bacterium]|nr:glycosyltransferase family 2 protein [Chloroflexota bacterium]
MLNVSKCVSIVIPLYNEAESLSRLHESLNRVLESQVFSYEIIYVDDGSTDGTFPILQHLAQSDPQVCIVRLARNFGQTAALAAGVAHSAGAILIFMDGDLQNDPLDIPRLVATLEQGYDVVSGWRKSRKDAQLSRKLPSWLANRLISQVTGLHLHDYGCTLKAYRRELFQHIRLYGEMHRFIPAYAALAGATVAEIEVAHHARRFGTSKYGLSRTIRVLLDLLTLKFLGSFGTKPGYAFGLPGLLSLAAGILLGVTFLGTRVFLPHVRSQRNALLPLSVHLVAFGLHCLMLGLLAELLMRTYHESQSKPIYVVQTIVPIPPIVDPQEETTRPLSAVS